MPSKWTTQPPTREQIRKAREVLEDFRAVHGDVPKRVNSSETDVGFRRPSSWTDKAVPSPQEPAARR
jgi:hypothetical protein